jgi:hypothetical protein
MSKVSDFKKYPESFLKKHNVRMEEFALPECFEVSDSGKTHKYKHKGWVDIEIHSGGLHGTDNLRIVRSTVDSGVRALPWRDSEMTYMKMDGSARWFFTGPIEGCYIYVARGDKMHISETYVFHVNANSVSGTQNMKAKDDMVIPVMRAKGLVPINRLTYDDYHPHDPTCSGQGFVYGWCGPLGWEFRVHSLSVKTEKVATGKQGYMTYETRSIKKFLPSQPLPTGIAMAV